MPLASQSPYHIIVYSVASYRPILVTFVRICNFCDPNLVTFYFYELTHFSFRLNEEHFTVSSAVTNILVLLLTVNMKNCLTPQNPKMCGPILVTRPNPAAHPHYPLLGKYPPGLEFSGRAWTNCSKYFQVNLVMI